MDKIYKLYTDGSHMPEHQKAGIGGYLLNPQGKVVFEFSELIRDDNLLAKHEVMALEKGLVEASKRGVREIKCFTDYKKLVDVFSIRNPTQRAGWVQSEPVLERINILLRRFDSISFEYLPRLSNKKADKLSRKVLLQVTHHSVRSIEQGLSISNLHSPQRYSRQDKPIFTSLKKDIPNFLVVDIPPEVTPKLTFHKALKIKEAYTYELIDCVQTTNNWVDDALMHICAKLEGLIRDKFFVLSGNRNKPDVIISLKENKEILGHLLRGLAQVQGKFERGINHFKNTCALFNNVVIHFEGNLVDLIYPRSRSAQIENKPGDYKSLMQELNFEETQKALSPKMLQIKSKSKNKDLEKKQKVTKKKLPTQSANRKSDDIEGAKKKLVIKKQKKSNTVSDKAATHKTIKKTKNTKKQAISSSKVVLEKAQTVQQ